MAEDKTLKDRTQVNEKKCYEKPEIIWEDELKRVGKVQAFSCALAPLEGDACDARPNT